MTCEICAILENKKEFKLVYEDELCFAILHESPAVAGHTMVIPKKHATIIEELDDSIVEHLFITANKISSAIFETIGAHGTNIIINNGTDAGQELAHVVVNVIPRKEGDEVNFEWPIKQTNEAQLKTTKSMMEIYAQGIYSGKDNLPEVKVKKQDTTERKKENYLIKGLRRMP